MDKEIIKGIKIGFGFFLTISLLFLVSAIGFHTASEILPGTFLGNFNFNGNVNISGNITIDSIDMTPAKTQTINLDSSMSAAQIQEKIDAVPKYIPAGRTVTFQFADGTYDLNSGLTFEWFYGEGNLLIVGNTGNTILHTNQEVTLDFSTSTSSHSILVSRSQILTTIKNLHIKFTPSNNGQTGIHLGYNSMPIFIYYSYFESLNNNVGVGLEARMSKVWLQNNYFNNINTAIISYFMSNIYSTNNDDTGTPPTYALVSRYGSIISKSGTQPAGAESTADGGVIN